MQFNKQNKTILTGASILIIIVTVLIFALNNKSKKIVKVAKKYLGEEEKGKGNQDFQNPDFKAKMINSGWRKGYEWCSIFASHVWQEALKGKYKEQSKKNLSISSQATYINFAKDKSGLFEVSYKPKKGSLIIWQAKDNAQKGHVGIVTQVNGDNITTVEGNQNKGGSAGIVATLNYSIEKEKTQGHGNLKLRGFVNIK